MTKVINLQDARRSKIVALFDPAAKALGDAVAKIDPFMTQGQAAEYFEWYAQILQQWARDLREDANAPLVGEKQ